MKTEKERKIEANRKTKRDKDRVRLIDMITNQFLIEFKLMVSISVD